MKPYILNEYHIKLLSRICMNSDNQCEFGAFECDGKRPYGNSDVIDDMRKILKVIMPVKCLRELHFSLHAAIKCISCNPDKTPFELIGTDLRPYGLVDRYNKLLFKEFE